MFKRELWTWLHRWQRLIIYTLGSLIVTVWTLLRFFTQRTIFDLVSQQVIVHQWLHGTLSSAHMGQTAYVPKMLLLYAPLDVLPGSPRLKLIVLTVLINVATFVLLGLVLEKLLREFGVRIGTMFYAALLWLSTIAGSAFWIEFANSRNLEVAGGLLWMYLGLRFLSRTNWWYAAVLTALGGLVFFSDPLQLYMSALPLLSYIVLLVVAKRENVKVAARLLGVTVAGYLLAQLLFAVAGHWLRLSFSDTGGVNAPPLSFAWVNQSAGGAVKALVSLFAGAADAGRLRELTNVSFLVLSGAALVHMLARRLVPRRLVVLVLCILTVDIAVYIASGQAVQGAATSRYLIMLAPAAVLALSTIRLPRVAQPQVIALIAVMISINVCALGTTLQRHWNTSFPEDAHLESAYRYVLRHPGFHVYASADTAMPVLYLHGTPATDSLPVGCSSGRLVETHFSMDAVFARNAASPGATAALLFDGDIITNKPNVCTLQSARVQFGPPASVDRTDDGSVVFLYPQARIRFPN